MKAKNWPLEVVITKGADVPCPCSFPNYKATLGGITAWAFWNCQWVNGSILNDIVAVATCKGRREVARSDGYAWALYPVHPYWAPGEYQWPSTPSYPREIEWAGDIADPHAPGHRVARLAIRKALVRSWGHAILRAGSERDARYRMVDAASTKARWHHADVVVRDDGLFFVAPEGETRIDHQLSEDEKKRAVDASWKRAFLKWDSR